MGSPAVHIRRRVDPRRAGRAGGDRRCGSRRRPPAGRRKQAPSPADQSDGAARNAGDRHSPPVAAYARRSCGCRHDPGAVATEDQRREQAHPVELGLRLEPDPCCGGCGVEHVAERRPWRLEQQLVVDELASRSTDSRSYSGCPPGTISSRSSSNSGSTTSSVSSTGRFSTARSTAPETRLAPGSSWSRRGPPPRPRGNSSPSALSSGGTSHRAVVPITPSRTCPEIDVAQRGHVGVECFELGLDASCPFEHGPALVGRLGRGPVDEGQAELAFEPGDVGGDVGLHSVRALALRPRTSGAPATASRALSCFRSIAEQDTEYRYNLLVRLLAAG